MATTYEKIASVTVGSGGAADIEFTSIPATFDDLVVKLSLRSNAAGATDNAEVIFNANTSNYSGRRLFGDGSGAASGTVNYDTTAFVNGNGSTSSTFGSAAIYIPNYAGSTNKSYSVDSVSETNATTAYTAFHAMLWSNTTAISSIKIEPNGGSLWNQHSTAVLYGIKKS